MVTTLDKSIEDAKNCQNVYLYGAQAVAAGIYNSLITAYSVQPTGFLVTSQENNPKELESKPVLLLENLTSPPEYTYIFISVPEYLHKEISENLKNAGYTKFLCIDTDIEYEFMSKYFRKINKFSLLEDLTKDYEINRPNQSYPKIEVYMVKTVYDKVLKQDVIVQDYIHSIQGGTAISKELETEFKDNIGENISHKNRNYAELTVTYWVWKNCNSPYKGICHYRRFLKINEKEIQCALEKSVDVILPLPFLCSPDTSAQYERYNHPLVMNAMFQALNEKEEGLGNSAKVVLEGKFLYNYNMLIAKAEVFDEYCEWMFPVLERVEELCEDLEIKENIDRMCGHLGEILTSLYFTMYAKKFNIVHAQKVWLV